MSIDNDSQKKRRKVRRDARDEGDETQIGFRTVAGDTGAWRGDDDAPWTEPLGRASDDASTGLTTAQNGENQRVAVDENGILWTRAAAVGVQMVEGDVAHDAADSNTLNFPVKIGGRAIDGVPTAVAAADRVNALFTLLGQLGTIPWPTVTDDAEWVADAALAASGAFTASSIIDVTNYRRLGLKLRYAPGAAGGYPQVILLVSASAAQPLTTDDEWYAVVSNDGSVTATLLTGAMPAGTDVTIAPEWGSQTLRPLVARLEAGDSTDDRIRVEQDFDVTNAKWAYLLYAEEGVTGTPGTFGAVYNLAN